MALFLGGSRNQGAELGEALAKATQTNPQKPGVEIETACRVSSGESLETELDQLTIHVAKLCEEMLHQVVELGALHRAGFLTEWEDRLVHDSVDQANIADGGRGGFDGAPISGHFA